MRDTVRRTNLAGGWLAVVLALALPGVLLAADDAEKLRQKQVAQEKARVLARELVSGILDLQIRQLEENGLGRQPVLRDIREMQKHVDTLSAKQMEQVVQLLVKAQEGSSKERLARFQEARNRVREIVVELMSERQKLYRRLQVARVSAQVRQLIGYETKVLNVTRALPNETPDRRDTLLFNTLEDQTDVAALYLQLVATLKDLTSWSGDVAAGAADGLRVLKAAAIDEELKGSLETLRDSKFPEATQHEEAVIRGLKALLQKLEESRGQVTSDREAALKMVRDMMKKQEQLRDQTRQADLAPPKRDELVQQQQQVQEQLGQLAQELDKYPTTQPLLEQAKAASLEATQQLFEEKRAETLAEQSKVIGSLAEVAQQLQRAVDLEQGSKSADQLAAEVRQLEKTQQEVAKAEQMQDQAQAAAEKEPAAAKAQEEAVAKQLEQAATPAELSPVIKSQLEDARQAAQEAADMLAKAAAAPADQQPQAKQAAAGSGRGRGRQVGAGRRGSRGAAGRRQTSRTGGRSRRTGARRGGARTRRRRRTRAGAQRRRGREGGRAVESRGGSARSGTGRDQAGRGKDGRRGEEHGAGGRQAVGRNCQTARRNRKTTRRRRSKAGRRVEAGRPASGTRRDEGGGQAHGSGSSAAS